MMNLERKIHILMSKDGVFQFARKGSKDHHRFLKIGYLPCASVDTAADAEALQVYTCKLSYDGVLYKYPIKEQTLDGLEMAGRELEQIYLRRRQQGEMQAKLGRLTASGLPPR